jgi:hypothetical protein
MEPMAQHNEATNVRWRDCLDSAKFYPFLEKKVKKSALF